MIMKENKRIEELENEEVSELTDEAVNEATQGSQETQEEQPVDETEALKERIA